MKDTVLTLHIWVFFIVTVKFVSAIISDYVVSVIFTLLGISRVVAAINKDAYGVINDSEYLEEDDEEKVIKELKKSV